MKKLAYFILTLGLINSTDAQIRPTPYEWRATLKTVDEIGKPVPEAEVVIGFAIESPLPESAVWDKIIGVTDTNGMFTTSHRDRSIFLSFQTKKDGYYPFGIQHDLGFSPQNHPEKLKPTVTLVLKRVINPIPMYAKRVNVGVPVLDKAVGFDLTVGDWVAPYGIGSSSHVIFTAHLQKRAEDDSDFRLEVGFPNPGDGIQEFAAPLTPVGEGSRLRSPHQAPADGYLPKWIQVNNRRPGQAAFGNRDPNRNYFFRVRTILDEKGNVKSALYGKVYGDFLDFRYFLNPEPNSRNVEFDPKRNLMKKLGPSEHVNQP